MKAKIKENIYLLIAEFFIWVVPLVLLVLLACESKSKPISMKLWGGVVLVVIALVYFVGLRKAITRKIEFEKHEQLRVPVWLRIVQGLITMICFVAIILVIQTIQDMFTEIMTFIICVMVSVALGYVFLIIDSKNRKPKKIIRQE